MFDTPSGDPPDVRPPTPPVSPLGQHLARQRAEKEQDEFGEMIGGERTAIWETKLFHPITVFALQWLGAWTAFGDKLLTGNVTAASEQLLHIDDLLNELQRIYDDWRNERDRWFRERAELYHQSYPNRHFSLLHPYHKPEWLFFWARDGCKASTEQERGPRMIPHHVALWVSQHSRYWPDKVEPLLLLGELGTATKCERHPESHLQLVQETLSKLTNRGLIAEVCPVLAAIVLPAPSVIEGIPDGNPVDYALLAFKWCDPIIGQCPSHSLIQAGKLATDYPDESFDAEKRPQTVTEQSLPDISDTPAVVVIPDTSIESTHQSARTENTEMAVPKSGDPTAVPACMTDPPSTPTLTHRFNEFAALVTGSCKKDIGATATMIPRLLASDSSLAKCAPGVLPGTRIRCAYDALRYLSIVMNEVGWTQQRVEALPDLDLGQRKVVIDILARALRIAATRPEVFETDEKLWVSLQSMIDNLNAGKELLRIRDEILNTPTPGQSKSSQSGTDSHPDRNPVDHSDTWRQIMWNPSRNAVHRLLQISDALAISRHRFQQLSYRFSGSIPIRNGGTDTVPVCDNSLPGHRGEDRARIVREFHEIKCAALPSPGNDARAAIATLHDEAIAEVCQTDFAGTERQKVVDSVNELAECLVKIERDCTHPALYPTDQLDQAALDAFNTERDQLYILRDIRLRLFSSLALMGQKIPLTVRNRVDDASIKIVKGNEPGVSMQDLHRLIQETQQEPNESPLQTPAPSSTGTEQSKGGPPPTDSESEMLRLFAEKVKEILAELNSQKENATTTPAEWKKKIERLWTEARSIPLSGGNPIPGKPGRIVTMEDVRNILQALLDWVDGIHTVGIRHMPDPTPPKPPTPGANGGNELKLVDGPFGTDGFRFRGVEVHFGRAALQRGLVLALWDDDIKRPREARPIEAVQDEVWGEESDTSEAAFRSLCSEIRRRFESVECPLDIENLQGKVCLIIRPL